MSGGYSDEVLVIPLGKVLRVEGGEEVYVVRRPRKWRKREPFAMTLHEWESRNTWSEGEPAPYRLRFGVWQAGQRPRLFMETGHRGWVRRNTHHAALEELARLAGHDPEALTGLFWRETDERAEA